MYDRDADRPQSLPISTASPDAVLVFDGVFLMRPELANAWDPRNFVSTNFERTIQRAVVRERAVMSAADVERRWRERYIPSQQYYFATARPADIADVVVHNDDLDHPTWSCDRRAYR
ncbi:hypothetical protein [Nocardioides pantholopis]|uniref:hypothetical protein n=1 Tax=Nocardioides pantholopis TaxID=2483798 RepID=UPI0019D12DF6|nr:hypothetical protein [Nocardioides pantholopis]